MKMTHLSAPRRDQRGGTKSRVATSLHGGEKASHEEQNSGGEFSLFNLNLSNLLIGRASLGFNRQTPFLISPSKPSKLI